MIESQRFNSLSNVMFQKEGKTRSFSFENPNAIKGKAAQSSSELGASRKGAPFIRDFKPKETAIIADIDGPGVIQHFFFTVSDLLEEGNLEKLFLKMYWNWEEQPAVDCSVKEFFSSKGETQSVITAFLFILPARSFHCYIPMPFQKHAKVVLENRCERTLSVVAYQLTCVTEITLPSEVCNLYAKRTENDLKDVNWWYQ